MGGVEEEKEKQPHLMMMGQEQANPDEVAAATAQAMFAIVPSSNNQMNSSGMEMLPHSVPVLL